MTLDAVVAGAGGIRIAQRGAPPDAAADLRIGPVAEVALPPGPPSEARRSDGHVWRRHWLCDDLLVIEFVDLASVVVSGGGVVTFDRELSAELEQHLLFDHVLPLVLARQGRLVLHGAVIAKAGRAAVLVGPSGAGKSTFTAYAWQQGWTVGGDDGAVLLPTDPPRVEPTYPTVRLRPDSVALLDIVPEPGSGVVGKVRIAGRGDARFRQEPVDIGVIAFIRPLPEGAPATFERLSGVDAHASLFGSTFHAELSEGTLLPRVVAGLATVVEGTTVGRLHVPRGRSGLEGATAVLARQLEGGARA